MNFTKYQGTGNDFIIIDGRDELPALDVAHLCHRRFGIGADGLMILEPSSDFDFKMVYYNSDGNISSMCGNGGRCIAHFASGLGLGEHLHFMAIDGPHKALVQQDYVSLEMGDVSKIKRINNSTFELNTGSPHYVMFHKTPIDSFDLIPFAKSVRFSALYEKEGININVAFENKGVLDVRTYERGVEDETYSCGTGVTAAALAHFSKNRQMGKNKIEIKTLGGVLNVEATCQSDSFTDIILSGPATPVFSGKI